MATATRKCKVCGKEYEYCHTFRKATSVFRWQDVACCPEHGNTYFARVMAMRNATASPSSATPSLSISQDCSSEAYLTDDVDEYDELFETDFDEDDDNEDDE